MSKKKPNKHKNNRTRHRKIYVEQHESYYKEKIIIRCEKKYVPLKLTIDFLPEVLLIQAKLAGRGYRS